MPLFDFVCKSCGIEFEFLLLGGDRPFCPSCGSDNLEKQMSTFAFRSGGGASSFQSSAGSGSKCSGCSGGSCSSCH